MFNKKSIVLLGVDDKSKKGVLTIDCDGKFAKGRLRLYNFPSEPKGIISLGLYNEGKVVKAGLIKSAYNLYNFACTLDDDFQKFSCAVINFYNGEPNPILYGNSEGFVEQSEVFSKVLGELNEARNIKDVEDTLNKYNIDFDDDYKREIEEEIDNSLQDECDEKCEQCPYKKYYFENVVTTSLSEESKNNETLENKFYLELKPHIDKLFEDNPSEDYLEQLLPNSKWVKVSIDGEGNYYVLGLIYEDEKLLYICYGVPGVYQKNPPRELSGYPVWFPLEEDKPQGFGYWLSYQDAENGESIKAVVV